MPPDSVVGKEAIILKDMQRMVEAFHDPEDFAMRRNVLAPCSPFSLSRDLMQEAAPLGRK